MRSALWKEKKFLQFQVSFNLEFRNLPFLDPEDTPTAASDLESLVGEVVVKFNEMLDNEVAPLSRD